ncbi:PqqD family protein [Phenylobacterium sp.]|uniref:PqqD family protein n=1 Tax=Phenylobacterium sp. TaxID=1871053 RepID=UPI0027360A27|nr:PqqD family protein [Phenylobacterium sp.]MDP3660641.1 PqqD family protein [Phenylobacterium sp.]
MSDVAYAICGPSVVGEVIDGEAIIVDLRSGAYYSADGVGGAIWQAIEAGAGRQAIIDWALGAYPGQAGVVADVEGFLETLLANELVRADVQDAARPQIAAPQPYQAPALAVHKDMQDLITLDPIHDVDDMGWPTRKAAD